MINLNMLLGNKLCYDIDRSDIRKWLGGVWGSRIYSLEWGYGFVWAGIVFWERMV